VENKLKITIN